MHYCVCQISWRVLPYWTTRSFSCFLRFLIELGRFVGSPFFLGHLVKHLNTNACMANMNSCMHGSSSETCVFLKHLVYSFEWQTSRTVLILRRTVWFTLICTVAYYLVITITIKYYLLLVLMVVYNTEWCIWCCFFLKKNCFQTVAKIKRNTKI